MFGQAAPSEDEVKSWAFQTEWPLISCGFECEPTVRARIPAVVHLVAVGITCVHRFEPIIGPGHGPACKIARFRLLGPSVPPVFRARLAELSGAALISTTVDTFNRVTEMVKGAQKRMDAVVLGSNTLLELTRQRVQEGLKVRGLMEKRLVPWRRLSSEPGSSYLR